MANSNLLEELKIKIAPYIRSAIVGEQNRLGHGALFQKKVDNAENTYVLGGKTQTITSQNEQDFFKVSAFVEKFLRKEIGEANKGSHLIDKIIAEILHTLKYNSMSVERNAKNIFENQLTTDKDFAQVAEAFKRLESQGGLTQILNGSEVEGLSDVIDNGRYGEIKNDIISKQGTLLSQAGNLTQSQKDDLKRQIKKQTDEAIALQEKRKKEAKELLDQDPNKIRAVKDRLSELMKVARSNDKGSEAYENAVREMREIAGENKDIIASDKKLKKAIEEIRELRKIQKETANMANESSQLGE